MPQVSVYVYFCTSKASTFALVKQVTYRADAGSKALDGQTPVGHPDRFMKVCVNERV